MSREQTVLITLVVYKLALIAIGVWASRRNLGTTDFYLGGRRLGPLVAAVSASASSSSAWTLLGVSTAAYAWGLSALWLFPATVGGFLLNWLWVAPRMRRHSATSGAVTLTEVLSGSPAGRYYRAIMIASSVIIFVSFMFYVASQFQAAGEAFNYNFDLPIHASILVGAAIVLFYTLLGGFWAVSVTDTLQGILMAATAIVLPAAALIAVGGPVGLWDGLVQANEPALLSLTGEHAGIVAVGFVVGTLGIGLGYPGQPHVVNRFMALRDDLALAQARVIAIAWALIVYAGMLLLGLCARVVFSGAELGEQVFFAATNELFPPVVAGVMLAAVLSAIMSTADSQLLVASSSVAYDTPRALGLERLATRMSASRLAVAALCVAATVLALYAPEAVFTRVLFAWHALGSAFGPILVARLLGLRLRGGGALASILIGFVATITLNWVPGLPGDPAERLVPLLLAGITAIFAVDRSKSLVS